jgi:arginine decarboxylase
MTIEQTEANQAGPATLHTPLATALLRFADNRRTSWHMPGHGGGFLLPEWLAGRLTTIDTTELAETDDLNRPEGPAREAMQLAASAFGAGITRFITTGSTTAIQIMLALAVGRRGRILVSRCCHQSVVHAAAMLDLDVRLLPASGYAEDPLSFADRSGSIERAKRLALLPQSTVADVTLALQANPGCRAILLTSPDYYGSCADLRRIADLAHAAGALLLVDEAHGAHLAFCPDLLPEAAMAAGADICVQSGHKTLPVLTQGAYLHVSAAALAANRLDQDDLERLIPVFQTSSPSFPIAATLDFARAYLTESGDRLIRRQKERHDQFAESLSPEWICQPWVAGRQSGALERTDHTGWHPQVVRDPLRLILTVRDPDQVCLVKTQADNLAAAGIDIEFADLTRLVLIPSLEQTTASWQQLARNLVGPSGCPASIDQKSAAAGRRHHSAKLLQLEEIWRQLLAEPLNLVISPGELLFGSTRPAGQLSHGSGNGQPQPGPGRPLRRVNLRDAVGRVAAAAILPYPPGIPLIWPGERLDQMRVDFLSELLENRTSISGIDQGKLLVLA